MAIKVKVEGLRELENALEDLPKATGKNVLRRVLKKRAKPIADTAEAKAPYREGHLAESIGVGTKLSRRQSALHRKAQGKSTVEMFVGAGTNPQSITQEFGTFKEPAQPFMRPAWDAHKGKLLDQFGEDLWTEISKSAKRLARKQAKAGKG